VLAAGDVEGLGEAGFGLGFIRGCLSQQQLALESVPLCFGKALPRGYEGLVDGAQSLFGLSCPRAYLSQEHKHPRPSTDRACGLVSG
jgi:hypothetical protein